MLEHGRQRVGQSALGVRHDESRGRAGHSLEVLQLEGGVQEALARTTSGTDNRLVRAIEQSFALHLVHVYLAHIVVSVVFESVRYSGSFLFVKVAEDDAFFEVGAADAVELLPHGLASVERDAVVGTPLVNPAVDFMLGVEERRAAAPKVQPEERVDSREDSPSPALPEVVVVFGSPVVAVRDYDGDHILCWLVRDDAFGPLVEVSVQQLVLVGALREADWFPKVENQPLLDVSRHLDVYLYVLHEFLIR